MQSKSRRLSVLASILGALAASLALMPAASVAAAPEFTVYVNTPDSAMPGESLDITVAVENTGDAKSSAPLVISVTPGPELSAPFRSENFIFSSSSVIDPETEEEKEQPANCETTGSTFTCTIAEALPPGGQHILRLESTVAGSASGVLTNRVSVSGGGVPTQISEQQIAVGTPGPFGFKAFAATLFDEAKNPVLQAAADPAAFTTSLRFRTTTGAYLSGLLPITASVKHFKNVTVHLPVGLVGNPTAAPVCTAAALAHGGACPIDSQVGVVHLELSGIEDALVGLYNMAPPPGAAAELGFEYAGTVITLDAYLRASDQGIDIVSRDTSTTLPATAVEVTVWGDPASHSHDRLRGKCLASNFFPEGATGAICPSSVPEKAFLRMPTSCSGAALPFGVEANSYESPDETASASFTGPTLTGCERVPFSPTIFVQPTTTAANSPTGVAVQLSVPQNQNPIGLGEADLKKAVVTLPEGMALNPSAADGLTACSDSQFKAEVAGVSQCPEASKVGSVVVNTPLLETPIEGAVYVLSQESSDPESGQMFRLGMELRDDRHGIDIKVPGQVRADKDTGRLTATFDNDPQLPFDHLTLHFKSGARAPLTTPAECSAQTTEADLYPWSAADTAVHRTMTFDLTSGPEGTPCSSRQPFDPGFNAGVSSVQAGGFTPFLVTFARSDADQSMQRVSVKMPPGLLGSLSGLPLCGEAQANAGSCDQASEIGSVTAGAGDGPTPFYVTGGEVFMTGPYEGAPFGLSVVVPAKAGPFDLGTVVVRAKVEVDPHTAQLTITTDPLPQIIGGVPVNLRLVNVTVGRPNFVFNPTDCNPSSVTGTMTGGQGAVAALANHFQVTNCGALGFAPKFSVSTSGKTSRADGASLDAKLVYPGSAGQANIAKVKVSLPKQLPSRLTTLQKACLAATFEANPAACPAASRIGMATATTPILPVPLAGPVYFVSHGGEAFPDLVVVLQGYGVTVDLVGSTFISKAGITSTTFKSVPDVPVGTFELRLPEGPYSALATNLPEKDRGSLCGHRLTMPTTFTAQNGVAFHKNTPLVATGCRTSGHGGKRRRGGKATHRRAMRALGGDSRV